MSTLRIVGIGLLSCLAFEAGAAAQVVTRRVSLGSSGNEADDRSAFGQLSADGRFVLFQSDATNLVAGDTNGLTDLFVRDCVTGIVDRVSVDSSGGEADGFSWVGAMTPDARYVLFTSHATNLVAGDTNGVADAFVHDRLTGSTERVSVDSAGAEGNTYSDAWSISADGRFVTFWSPATNLVPGDTNSEPDVFVHDRQTGVTERVSVDSAGVEGDDPSYDSSISADGRFVAFQSWATLVPGDTNQAADIFVRDRQSGTTERVSSDSSGVEANGYCGTPVISADGALVAFVSSATNLVAGDTNRVSDIFVHDRQTAITERVSVSSAGAEGNALSMWPLLTGDGRFVVFTSWASNLVAGDSNHALDCFRHDRRTGTTERVSLNTWGHEVYMGCFGSGLSENGRLVAFESNSHSLVLGDTNDEQDVFVRGPALGFEADPDTVVAGDTLTLKTNLGQPFGRSQLYLTDLDGKASFFPVLPGSFDASGEWTVAGTVPVGLSGHVLGFATFGVAPDGKARFSNEDLVEFQ